MFSNIRNAALALAAVAAIGAATLVTSTTSADARGFGGGFHGGGMHAGGGMRMGGGVRMGARVHVGGPRFVNIRGPRLVGGPHLRPNWCRWHRCGIHVRWPRPILYGAAPVIATTYAVAPAIAAAPRPCTCLTKEYTPDNLVVFKDVCTKEVSSAPIGNTQTLLQLPQQTDQQPVQQQQQQQ